ncbi:hypothetical protein J7J90_01810 [Candidatus Micrarchaeota archaeon]|nr:hypothetical protein [Candidatus Micrarchaeota archaeon]
MHVHDLNDILKAGSKLREYIISRKKSYTSFYNYLLKRFGDDTDKIFFETVLEIYKGELNDETPLTETIKNSLKNLKIKTDVRLIKEYDAATSRIIIGFKKDLKPLKNKTIDETCHLLFDPLIKLLGNDWKVGITHFSQTKKSAKKSIDDRTNKVRVHIIYYKSQDTNKPNNYLKSGDQNSDENI